MMKNMLLAAVAAVSCCGCIQVKTESEIKPIHITMDINLKVDKSLDKAFQDENVQRPQGDFVRVKDMLDRQAAGITRDALLEPRASATDAERLFIAESNAKHLKRFAEIAGQTGTSLAQVQRQYAAKMREKVPAGLGVWVQSEEGVWQQK